LEFKAQPFLVGVQSAALAFGFFSWSSKRSFGFWLFSVVVVCVF
jgi:hypothetical protein